LGPFNLYDFRFLDLYDHSQKKFDKYLLTIGFGGAYNMNYKIYSVGKNEISLIPWLNPQFDEEIKTCNLRILDNANVSFLEEVDTNGYVDQFENSHTAGNTFDGEITVYRKWIGHGDFSQDITFRLIDQRFTPNRGKVDNCTDQKKKFTNIFFN